MKRTQFLRHLRRHGCRLLREGASHSVFENPRISAVSTVPRHREVNDLLARKICRDLEVPDP
ncbi:MAG: type II toxin-antitoxin system HicA family toxin [Actinobacteria bacterium]|nr:MAG: type II toxin-antitoxin system HicA family toxin [Actinomycetota bacterium]